MKVLKYVLCLAILFSALSCGSDDDICLSGEATPRMKLKFKTQATGKLKTLDSVFVNVDYGSGPVTVVAALQKTDSLLVPLRVDDVPFTKIYVGLSRTAPFSEVQVNYTTRSEYVSPACGIRRVYDNADALVSVPNAVVGVEQNQTQITDESKTHFFLLF